MAKYLSAKEFRRQLPHLAEELERWGEIVVLKRSKPLFKVVSFEEQPADLLDQAAAVEDAAQLHLEEISRIVHENRIIERPEICRFLGIIITMYFDEHNPPHFHVRYNDYRASVEIKTLNVITGNIPAKVRGLVEEWAELHRDVLLQMWESKDFHKVEPLV